MARPIVSPHPSLTCPPRCTASAPSSPPFWFAPALGGDSISTTPSSNRNRGGPYLLDGQDPRKLGNEHQSIVPYGIFRAQDGYLIIGCASEPIWKKLCDVLDLQDMYQDPRYHTNRERVPRRDEVRERIEERLATRSAIDWCQLLEDADVPSGPIYSVPQMLHDDQMQARGFIVDQQHPVAGVLRTLACPIHLSDTPATYRLPSPTLGQHTDDILAELGYSPSDIVGLHDSKAV
jgi:formyl-CoA transferase